MDKVLNELVDEIIESYESGNSARAVDLIPNFESTTDKHDPKDIQDFVKKILEKTNKWKAEQESYDLYLIEAFTYLLSGNFEESINKFDCAIEINKSDDYGYFARGNAYFDFEKYEEAILDYTRSIELEPKDSNAYLNRGNAYFEQGKFKEALDDYDNAILFEPDNYEALGKKGNLYYELKNYREAIDIYSRAIQLKPESFVQYYNRGNCYFRIDNYEDAIKDYKKAIKLEPELFEGYNNLGLALYNLNQLDEAEKLFIKSIELNSESYLPYTNYGILYNKKGEYDEAVKKFTKAIELNHHHPSSYFNRALAYSELEKNQEALNDFEVAEKLFKKSGDFIGLGNAREKKEEIQKLIESDKFQKVNDNVKKIKRILEFTDPDIGLTHYTSLTTARILLIEEEGNFRLSEASYLNDTSEGREFSNYLGVTVFEDQKRYREFIEKPFIGSFVTEKKCDDLTLWRMYGKENGIEAKGCSITFLYSSLLKSLTSRESIIDQSNDLHLNSTTQDLKFYKVAYIDQTDSNKIIIPDSSEEDVEELNKLMSSLKSDIDTLKNEEDLVSKRWISEVLEEIAYLFKSIEYQYEHEVRLIIPNKSSQFKKIIQVNTSNLPLVYIELGSIIPFVKQVTLGPKVSNSEEWASAFYYSLENEFSKSEDDSQSIKELETRKPKVAISRLPFK